MEDEDERLPGRVRSGGLNVMREVLCKPCATPLKGNYMLTKFVCFLYVKYINMLITHLHTHTQTHT